MLERVLQNNRWSRLFRTSIFLIAGLGVAFVALAATGFIDPNGDGTVQGTPTTCGGAGNYTCIDDAAREPTAPSTTGDYVVLVRDEMDYYDMSSISGIANASAIEVFVYHQESDRKSKINIGLYDTVETTKYGSRSIKGSTNAQWTSVNINNANLNQANLDELKIRLECIRGGASDTCTIYALYAVVTFSGTLGIDIVDAGGASVATPSVDFTPALFGWIGQQSSGTLGTAAEKIHVFNNTVTPAWSVTLAAADGPIALWDSGVDTYDYNDTVTAGRLLVDPSVATLTPSSDCANTGVSLGGAQYFSEGVLDSVTLVNADATAQTECQWDLTGAALTQDIPPRQPDGDYILDLVLTVS